MKPSPIDPNPTPIAYCCAEKHAKPCPHFAGQPCSACLAECSPKDLYPSAMLRIVASYGKGQDAIRARLKPAKTVYAVGAPEAGGVWLSDGSERVFKNREDAEKKLASDRLEFQKIFTLTVR